MRTHFLRIDLVVVLVLLLHLLCLSRYRLLLRLLCLRGVLLLFLVDVVLTASPLLGLNDQATVRLHYVVVVHLATVDVAYDVGRLLVHAHLLKVCGIAALMRRLHCLLRRLTLWCNSLTVRIRTRCRRHDNVLNVVVYRKVNRWLLHLDLLVGV